VSCIPSVQIPDSDDGLIVDLFAGGGGASIGIEEAFGGEHVDIAINHDAEAIAVHKANHPDTEHWQSDIWEVDPLDATRGRRVKFLHASPDCKHFSRAKGDVPKSHHIRALADVVLLWAAKTKPLVITLENVPEFVTWGPLGPDGKQLSVVDPVTGKKLHPLAGEFFDMWRAELVALGYIVDHWVLDASDYGAPTKRKRFFMVARRDGKPITKPVPTHGPPGSGRALWRTAAECLFFDRPIHSVLPCTCSKRGKGINCKVCGGRIKPLAEKTLRRIAAGIDRYVRNNPRPFVVKVNHGAKGADRRVASVDEPLSTIAAQRRGHALVVPTLVQTGYGERPGQRPRCLDIHEPMGTLVGGGQKHALVATFIAKHFGGVVGIPATQPISTITQVDHHAVVTASLVKYRGTSDAHDGAGNVDEPLPTISAQGTHAALVETTLQPMDRSEQAAFFIEYYGQGSGLTGAAVDKPLPTVTTKPRFALVMVNGVPHRITDIAMRMVDPDELARCQFTPERAAEYDDSAVKTKSGKTKLIGNSVPPDVERALAAANLPDTVNGWEFSARLAAAA
jgi:DNA (cytosine-5)-methyltransferase 1